MGKRKNERVVRQCVSCGMLAMVRAAIKFNFVVTEANVKARECGVYHANIGLLEHEAGGDSSAGPPRSD